MLLVIKYYKHATGECIKINYFLAIYITDIIVSISLAKKNTFRTT